MKLLLLLNLILQLTNLCSALDTPPPAADLVHTIQSEVLKNSFGRTSANSSENLSKIRETAISGLYNETSRTTSINFLTNLALMAQDGEAIIALADYFCDGEGAIEQAIPFYTFAVRQSNTRAIFKLSKIYLMDDYRDKNLAHSLLLLGTELNDDICRCALAQHYLDGTFGDSNPIEALKLFHKSAINNFDLGITQAAVLLNSSRVFMKPDSVHAYELVMRNKATDNRARILATELEKNPTVQLYINRNYLKLAEAYMTGKVLPIRFHRSKYFLNLAYKNSQISLVEIKYYNKLIHSAKEGLAWSKPTFFDKILNTLF
ncbi:MAG: hypothetical protein K0M45_11240 [Candidatus Paracaedibacteraceae bacterium]|nr:hypothetical protein [Candidatus Paracaedibacteraceae bacterium]